MRSKQNLARMAEAARPDGTQRRVDLDAAERAAAGTPEQPPIFGAPESPQVPAQEAGKLRGDRDHPDGALRAVFEAAGLAWGAVAGPGPR